MKKLLFLAFCIYSISLHANEFIVDNILYQIINDKAIIINGSDCSGDLEIPSSIEYNETTYIVSEIGDNAFRDNSKLKSISFPSSIEIIGEHAFVNCSNIENINFSEGLKEIKAYAFLYCTKPYYLVLPSTLQTIGKSAFGGRSNLKEVFSKSMTPPLLIFDFSINGTPDEYGYIPSAYPFGSNTNSITVYVPIGAKESYQKADGWLCSKEIIETENWTVSINDINCDNKSIYTKIYSIDGTPITQSNLNPGVYIIQKKINNKLLTKKVLIK